MTESETLTLKQQIVAHWSPLAALIAGVTVGIVAHRTAPSPVSEWYPVLGGFVGVLVMTVLVVRWSQ